MSKGEDDHALSQCSRNGVRVPCVECGYLTPVRMKLGERFWIRCFMCQTDGPEANTITKAIELWEAANEL